jgi:hypothetical protein
MYRFDRRIKGVVDDNSMKKRIINLTRVKKRIINLRKRGNCRYFPVREAACLGLKL